MNWRDEPVKVGDKFLTEKGGVVTVIDFVEHIGEIHATTSHGTGVWHLNGYPAFIGGSTDINYGPIIDKINKEKETMCDKQEWRTGPCTLTSKDGKSVLVGDVCHHTLTLFSFQITGAAGTNSFNKADWTPTYPLPSLPDKVGAVIEAGDGVRFMLTDSEPFPWHSTKERVMESGGNAHLQKYVVAHVALHGFKVLLDGK